MFEFIYQVLAKIGYTHPIHPAITHVPVGLIIGGFIFIFVGRFLKQPVLAETARHCMILALIFVPAAMFLGYLDWQHFYAGAWLFPHNSEDAVGRVASDFRFHGSYLRPQTR